jgi:hypothetical protein
MVEKPTSGGINTLRGNNIKMIRMKGIKIKE